jgi:hypothetical protein
MALGHSLVEVGRPQEAIEHLELAAGQVDESPEVAEPLAGARFELARILWDTDVASRPRAMALATAAHATYVAKGSSPAREELERWLASHRSE